MVGVFGLVVFDSEYRKKEIGIRKVLGSTTEEIIVMFNKHTYESYVFVCFGGRRSPVTWYIDGLRISLIRLLCIGGCI